MNGCCTITAQIRAVVSNFCPHNHAPKSCWPFTLSTTPALRYRTNKHQDLSTNIFFKKKGAEFERNVKTNKRTQVYAKTVRQLTVFVHELRIFSQNFDSLIKVTVLQPSRQCPSKICCPPTLMKHHLLMMNKIGISYKCDIVIRKVLNYLS